jgi:serine/threonine protein kinase|tara:strand:+ start:5230 stop:6006 length:777 start_codon:yes stop_codon:yes gene_type:complete
MTPRDAKTLTRIKQIGQGTYGAVYQCFDELTKNIVAVKKVKPARFDSSEAAAFAAREVSVLLKLKHQPHCVTLLDIAVDDCAGNEGHDDDIGINNSSNNSSESAYLVFAFSPHDLAGLVSATTKGGLRLGQVKRLAWQLFSAIASCHENGVLHRDIKGSNLLVDGNGVLKLADFGLAVDVGSARAARGDGDKDGGEKKKPEEIETTQRVPLTPRVVTLWYRPPELLLGATEYDGAGLSQSPHHTASLLGPITRPAVYP